MSELINNQRNRIDTLKELLKKLHSSHDVDLVKIEIEKILHTVPHEDVIAAEQELLADGMPLDKMLELCDLHSKALHGLVNLSQKQVPVAHPVAIMRKENLAITREIELIKLLVAELLKRDDSQDAGELLLKVHAHCNNLMDIEKHYAKKENLLFPFLEKYQITGPSTVMWGKDDQIRKALKDCITTLAGFHAISVKEGKIIVPILDQLLIAITDMIQKEEDILIPMSLETLTELDWFEIYKQSFEIGFTLIEVRETWAPEGIASPIALQNSSGRVQLPSGSFSLEELFALFSALPVDLTFVDKDDTVKFFTEGPERIFQRSRAIIGRKVQYCHPPHSVAIVEQILEDFKSGKQNKADFWIQMHGKFIYISYHALRNLDGEYLGTLEVSQNLTFYRGLEGEKRILSYDMEPTKTEDSKIEKQTTKEEGTMIIYDARQDLANGVHPASKVISELLGLEEGGKYNLITPFPPMPLIAKAQEQGFSYEQKKISETEFHTIFFKR